MNPEREPPKKLWKFQGRTRRHIYYTPTGNLQAILLFSLIALLGSVAVAFAGIHRIQLQAFNRQDATLGAIGLGCMILGIAQASTLIRQSLKKRG